MGLYTLSIMGRGGFEWAKRPLATMTGIPKAKEGSSSFPKKQEMEIIHCKSLFSFRTAAMFWILQLHIYQTKRTIARRVQGRQVQWNNTCQAQKDQELPTLQLPHYASPMSTAARPRWKLKPGVTGNPFLPSGFTLPQTSTQSAQCAGCLALKPWEIVQYS